MFLILYTKCIFKKSERSKELHIESNGEKEVRDRGEGGESLSFWRL
jgi:hypothetical protein